MYCNRQNMQMGEAMGDKTYENRETAIAVKNVSKVYKLYDKPMDRLKEENKEFQMKIVQLETEIKNNRKK